MVETLNNLMKNNAIAETLTIRQSILGHSLPLSAYLLKPVQRVLKYHLFMECSVEEINKMVETLNNLMKNNAIAETLTIRQSILGHSLPLSAYLLKPVQRVLKYHLFMENILKHSGETPSLSDSDRALIADALVCMTAQAEKINEEKKRVEHWERVKELQNALHRWCSEGSEDLSRYGDLLLEGTFKLAGSKTNRQLFLFEEMLMIVKERNGALICKDYIMEEWKICGYLAY
uniref:DH domain-containing protein n=1 Tax=Ascaris lumbricoides TaxID=6252 RepID=A0A0M3I465_ASCLU